MFTQVRIFELALTALSLDRTVVSVNDESSEVSILRRNWTSALALALADMDLDATSGEFDLELVTSDLSAPLNYGYRYPSDCLYFRRFSSGALVDNRQTTIDRRLSLYVPKGETTPIKIIRSGMSVTKCEYIHRGIQAYHLSPPAAEAVALMLASICRTLITGKNIENVQKELQGLYQLWKARAEAHDNNESFTYESDTTQSEWLTLRKSSPQPYGY